MGHRDDYKGRYKTFEHETDTKELFLVSVSRRGHNCTTTIPQLRVNPECLIWKYVYKNQTCSQRKSHGKLVAKFTVVCSMVMHLSIVKPPGEVTI